MNVLCTNRTEGRSFFGCLFRFVQTEPILGVNRRRFLFFAKEAMSTVGSREGVSAVGDEEMEDQTEME